MEKENLKISKVALNDTFTDDSLRNPAYSNWLSNKGITQSFNGNSYYREPVTCTIEETIPSQKNIADLTQKLARHPFIGPEFFPKHFTKTKTHYCPLDASTILFGTTAGKNHTVNKEVASKIHDERKKYNFPVYFVEDELLRMLRITKIKKELKLSAVNWPFDSIYFNFPRRSYAANGFVNGKPVYAMGVFVARTFDIQTLEWQLKAKEKGLHTDDNRMYDPEASSAFKEILHAPHFSQKEYDDARKKYESRYGGGITVIESVSFAVPLSDGSMCTMSYPINAESFLDTLNAYQNAYTYEDQQGNVSVPSRLGTDVEYILPDGVNIADETALMQELAKDAIKLVFYMSARQEEWESKTTLHKISKDKKTRGKKIWNPLYLGRKYKNYRQEKEQEAGSGKRLRYHWREGYYGVRWVGKKGQQTQKVVWVMPYPVNEDLK